MTMSSAATATTLAAQTGARDIWRTWQPSPSSAHRAPRRLLTDPISAKLSLPSSEIEFVVTQPEPVWLYPVLSRLQHLSFLADNWDSYGGRTPTATSLFIALAVIAHLLRDESAAPTIVPLSEGGVQIEWHRDGEELEIRIGADGEISAFRFDEHAGQLHEVDRVTLSNLTSLLALTGRR